MDEDPFYNPARPHMFRNLKFPLLYVIEGILLPLMICGFFVTASFYAARPLASLDLHGKALPANWEAAVPNHGGYYGWYLLTNHPVLFTLGLLLWLVPLVTLNLVRKAQVLQRQEAGASRNTAHAIARALVVAAFMLTAYWFVFHVTVIVKPA